MADLNVIAAGTQVAGLVQGNLLWLGIGLALIIAGIVLFMFLKKIIVNSLLGLGLFIIFKFVFSIQLPFIPALVISVIFGPAGIGTMLLLKFLGLM
ncbi:hypothetical protein HZB89_01540 [archaeon]|nr:hypothetical protein [archaeon]